MLLEKMLWAPLDQIGSESSGTRAGVFDLCIANG
jgi:hypothetical protein